MKLTVTNEVGPLRYYMIVLHFYSTSRKRGKLPREYPTCQARLPLMPNKRTISETLSLMTLKEPSRTERPTFQQGNQPTKN